MTEQLKPEQQSKKRPNVPTREADLITVAKDVHKSWGKYPDFKLK